jgi:predicted transcriptional regulator
VRVDCRHLVHIGARVEPELAAAVTRLAALGDRSVSRQVRRELAEHVERQQGLSAQSVSASGQRSRGDVAPAAPEVGRGGES